MVSQSTGVLLGTEVGSRKSAPPLPWHGVSDSRDWARLWGLPFADVFCMWAKQVLRWECQHILDMAVPILVRQGSLISNGKIKDTWSHLYVQKGLLTCCGNSSSPGLQLLMARHRHILGCIPDRQNELSHATLPMHACTKTLILLFLRNHEKNDKDYDTTFILVTQQHLQKFVKDGIER